MTTAFFNFETMLAPELRGYGSLADEKRNRDTSLFRQELRETKVEEKIKFLSFRAADYFVFELFQKSLPLPIIETFPQGYFAFTWRKERKGIINLAFVEQGMVTYVAYLEGSDAPLKGEFHHKKSPEAVFELIR